MRLQNNNRPDDNYLIIVPLETNVFQFVMQRLKYCFGGSPEISAIIFCYKKTLIFEISIKFNFSKA